MKGGPRVDLGTAASGTASPVWAPSCRVSPCTRWGGGGPGARGRVGVGEVVKARPCDPAALLESGLGGRERVSASPQDESARRLGCQRLRERRPPGGWMSLRLAGSLARAGLGLAGVELCSCRAVPGEGGGGRVTRARDADDMSPVPAGAAWSIQGRASGGAQNIGLDGWPAAAHSKIGLGGWPAAAHTVSRSWWLADGGTHSK